MHNFKTTFKKLYRPPSYTLSNFTFMGALDVCTFWHVFQPALEVSQSSLIRKKVVSIPLTSGVSSFLLQL